VHLNIHMGQIVMKEEE